MRSLLTKRHFHIGYTSNANVLTHDDNIGINRSSNSLFLSALMIDFEVYPM